MADSLTVKGPVFGNDTDLTDAAFNRTRDLLETTATCKFRPPWMGEHEHWTLEVVCHLLYAEGYPVDNRALNDDGSLVIADESSWEDIKGELVRYLHCTTCDQEWSIRHLA